MFNKTEFRIRWSQADSNPTIYFNADPDLAPNPGFAVFYLSSFPYLKFQPFFILLPIYSKYFQFKNILFRESRTNADPGSGTLTIRYIFHTWRGARAGRSDGRPERSCPAWRRAGFQPPRSQPKYQEHPHIFDFSFGGLECVFIFLRDV